MSVVRTWHCQSERCGRMFDSWDRYPACPDCGNVRTAWVPRPVAIAGSAAKLDATLRDLSAAFGLTNLNSAKTGERAKPNSPAAKGAGAEMQFAPGFTAPITESAICVPSSTKVDFKLGVGTDKKFVANGNYPSLKSQTTYDK